MKILLVNKGIYPWLGGIETAVRMYANAYKDLGHEVTILVSHQVLGVPTSEDELDEIKVVRCRTNLKISNLNISMDLMNYIVKNSYRYDLIHFNEPHFLGLLSFSAAKKVPYFISFHAELTKFGILPRFLEILLSRLYKKSKRIIIGNPTFTYRKGLVKDNIEKIALIPYCDEIKKLEESTFLENVSIEIPPKYFFIFSRYSHYKGYEVLEKSIGLLNDDVHFVLAISGSIPEKLKNALVKRKNVLLINRNISEAEKLYLFQNSLCYVFPSINITESFGITQVEALKHGKPIINTYLPSGVPIVSIHNITGLTVFPNNSIELAEALNTMWTLNEDLYRKMSERCVERYEENFSYQRFERSISELIKTLNK